MCGLCRVGEQALLALWGAERDGQGPLSLGTWSSQTQGCARTPRAPPPQAQPVVPAHTGQQHHGLTSFPRAALTLCPLSQCPMEVPGPPAPPQSVPLTPKWVTC